MNASPTFTVTQLAQMLEYTQGAMSKKLADLEPDEVRGRSKRFRLVRVLAHINGTDLDPTYERARLSKEQADEKAMDNAVRRGELAPMEWYEQQLERYTRQLAAMLDSLPNRLRQLLPHLNRVDHARIAAHLSHERKRLADRLAGRGGEGEAGGGEGGFAAADAGAAAA